MSPIVRAGCGIVVLGLASTTACERWDPPPRELRFELLGAHTSLTCEQCHTTGQPYTWIDPTCTTCHEADRKVPAPGHYAPQSCDAAGCHKASDLTWGDIGGGTGTGFHDFFPLVDAHDQDCTACHATADPPPGDLAGYGLLCWNCHEEDRKDPTHYVNPTPAPGVEPREDCGPCHAPVTWSTDLYLHEPRVPHGRARTDDGGLSFVPIAEASWVTACADCHQDAPDDYETHQCLVCHADDPDPHNGVFGDSQCVGCHSTAEFEPN